MSENHRGTLLLPAPEQDLGWSKERQMVQAEAHLRLRNSGYHELCLVSCDFYEGVLTLRGQVSSFHLKQVAQELMRRLDGAAMINNYLEVAVPTCPS